MYLGLFWLCGFSGEGRITKIAWNPTIPLVAWANEVGVKVLDVISKEKISFVPYHEQTRRIQKQNPWLNASLLWLNEVVLVMGYGTIIQVWCVDIGCLVAVSQMTVSSTTCGIDQHITLRHDFDIYFRSVS